jgi:hypothetical protein
MDEKRNEFGARILKAANISFGDGGARSAASSATCPRKGPLLTLKVHWTYPASSS